MIRKIDKYYVKTILNKGNDKGNRSVENMKHLIDMAIKFSLTLVEYVAFFEEACVPMGFQEMLSKYQGFTFDKGVRLYSQHNQHHKIEDSINCIGKKTISHLLHKQVTRRVIDVM